MELTLTDLATPEPADLDLRDIQAWRSQYWTELENRISTIFPRSELRRRARAYLAGLLSPAERKNSWQLAEISGDLNPYGFQHLLGRAAWEADTLRDQLRTYLTKYLADPDAIGVIDETGFLKKGRQSVGVARQYSGTAGRIENCQIGVFLSYASRHGHSLLDRELYLPSAWTDDPERCRRAGVPEQRTFLTKPALAQQMLERTFAAGVRLAWVTGDSIYGDARILRSWLEERGQAYVLAVSGKEAVWRNRRQQMVKDLLTDLPDTWEQISAGMGSKGPRWYEWQRLEVAEPARKGWRRWLVVRRSITSPEELTAYVAYAPAPTKLADLVRVAGMRWTVEESIQTAKGEVGLDHYEVRSWTGWYRHITLAMWAQAFMAVVRKEAQVDLIKKGQLYPQTSSLAAFKAHRGLQSG